MSNDSNFCVESKNQGKTSSKMNTYQRFLQIKNHRSKRVTNIPFKFVLMKHTHYIRRFRSIWGMNARVAYPKVSFEHLYLIHLTGKNIWFPSKLKYRRRIETKIDIFQFVENPIIDWIASIGEILKLFFTKCSFCNVFHVLTYTCATRELTTDNN